MAKLKQRKFDLKSVLGLQKSKKPVKKKPTGAKRVKGGPQKHTNHKMTPKTKSFNLLQWFRRKTK